MPQFLAAIGTAVLGSVGVAVTVGTAAGFAIAVSVGVATIGFVTYAATRGAKLRSSGDAGTAATQQILVRSTTEPRKIVYGEALVSGPLVFMNTNGDAPAPNGSLYAVVALTGHEIESFQGFYLDDKFVPVADVDTAGDGSVDADTGGHGYAPVGGTPVLYLRGHLGAAAQTVDTMLDSGFTIWTSNHRLRGVAYLVARMDQLEGAEEVWEQGAPANISAVIQGKLVYDPRLDSTFTGTWGTGSGAHRLNNPATWEWSDNPALCLADYLIDSDLGAGFDSARIDYNSVAFAADDCDDTVAIPTSSTETRFTCNGVLSCLDDHRENIEKILSSMAGTLRYYNGLWRISAGMWPGASSFALTESDLVGPITFQPQPERTERYNAVRGLYFDPSRSYKESAFLSVEDATLQADRDDSLVLWKELDLPMTNSETMCQRLAFRMIAQASRPGVCVFPMGYRGMDIAPGDRGTVTVSELGWSAKTFRCIGLRHVDMVGVELVLKEDDSAAYDDPAEGNYGTRSAAGALTFPKPRTDWPRIGDSMIADPYFTRSVEMWDGSGGTTHDYLRYFWLLEGATGGSSCAIARTGGVIGGLMQITAAVGGTVVVYSLPREFSHFISGERFRINVRVRKTNAVTTLTAADFQFWGVSTVANPLLMGGILGSITIDITHTQINGWTVNQWQEFEGEFVPTQNAKNLTQIPYVAIYMLAENFDVATNLEIDAANISRIQT